MPNDYPTLAAFLLCGTACNSGAIDSGTTSGQPTESAKTNGGTVESPDLLTEQISEDGESKNESMDWTKNY